MALPTFNPDPRPTSAADQPEIKLLKAAFGDGYTQESPDGSNHIREVWNLTWDTLLPAQAATIRNFFKERGGYKPFYFELEEGEVKKWTCTQWSKTRGTPQMMTATFREYFGLET